MGFIDALRAWLFGADDDATDAGESDDEAGASGDDGDASDGDDGDASDGDEPDGLDPAGATETRTASATDDAVDALRDVRRSQDAGTPDDADGGGRAPDDDRTKPSDGGGTNR
ncbi:MULTISPECIES: hypothetical protein [Halorubrum]|uniref:Uncharacterized protein n=1 Tax=Halorubrum tropicale TaxID=1765655 RepID=A0A0M9AQ37_9EURY|nr:MULTISPECIES: hypothetical protein [Halorubrum]KOX96048.1 hypothetical protein AMR74_10935 [Halorubrum tropicale]TKX45958.1 hypothetical protein EXE50_01780 [Halorubrum sp. ARQ200]TKX61711.1 hypothetical protein EXE48_07890 [Halorubrum sp. ASP1]